MYKNHRVTAIITAGGRGTRIGGEVHKQFLRIDGRTILEKSALPFLENSVVDRVLITLPSSDMELGRSLLPQEIILVEGGKERQDSVWSALEVANPQEDEIVLIHDGVRPYVDDDLIMSTIEAACRDGAAICGISSTDTIRHRELGTLDREKLYRVQTPQGFKGRIIWEAYERAREDSFYGTDDAGLVERCGYGITIVPGKESNIKITTREDFPVKNKIGTGYDVHRFAENRKLILGGVTIPYIKGLDGHSDADVATHALMDALLGAAGLPDIGRLFPDKDPKYEGISSMILLKEVRDRIRDQGYEISNVDITIICQAPKLAPYMDEMRNTLAAALSLEPEDVGLKATTTEGLGFTGREEGIAAEAVCLLTSKVY